MKFKLNDQRESKRRGLVFTLKKEKTEEVTLF